MKNQFADVGDPVALQLDNHVLYGRVIGYGLTADDLKVWFEDDEADYRYIKSLYLQRISEEESVPCL